MVLHSRLRHYYMDNTIGWLHETLGPNSRNIFVQDSLRDLRQVFGELLLLIRLNSGLR